MLRLRVLTSGLDIPLETSPANRKEPESHQRSPQRRGAGELDPAKPEVGCRVDVRCGVVDEDRLLRFDTERLYEVLEDPPVGLVHSDLARADDPLEPCQEVEPLQRDRTHLRRPVADGDKPATRGAA